MTGLLQSAGQPDKADQLQQAWDEISGGTVFGDFAAFDPDKTSDTPPLTFVPADHGPARGWYKRFKNTLPDDD